MRYKEKVTKYHLPTSEIKNYNVMIDRQNFFDQPVRNSLITYYNIRKIGIGQGDNYTTGCLLDYDYLTKYYDMIAIDLSKHQALDADPKAIEQINFIGNLEHQATIISIIEEAKKTSFRFFTRNSKSILILFFSLT